MTNTFAHYLYTIQNAFNKLIIYDIIIIATSNYGSKFELTVYKRFYREKDEMKLYFLDSGLHVQSSIYRVWLTSNSNA